MSIVALNGWSRFNIWQHSSRVHHLYRQRVRREVEEMTCAAQAAELLSDLATPGDSVLDIGCGSGYFYHSIAQREMQLDYYGLDACVDLIAIGQETLPDYGLPADHLVTGRIEDLNAFCDHVICLNVLSNLDNVHRPLERLLRTARKSLILRESIKEGSEYRYVIDHYLDAEEPLYVHVNAYDREEIMRLAAEFGFETHFIQDRRTGGKPEMVIDYPHYWTFAVMQPMESLR